jgi:hypothetical protein
MAGVYRASTRLAHGRFPTIREIGAGVSINSTSVVNYTLSELMELG